jgi:hypothetical protein
VTKHTQDPTAIFQRNVAKIDRRLQKPNLTVDARRAQLDFRKTLDGEVFANRKFGQWAKISTKNI